MYKSPKNLFIFLIGVFIAFVGNIVIAGWLLDIPALKSLVPGQSALKFNLGLAFSLYGYTLLITQYPAKAYSTILFFIFSIGGTAIGLITLSEFLFHFNSGFDQLFVTDTTNVSPRSEEHTF